LPDLFFSHPLAFQDFDTAIDHQIATAQAYLERGYIHHWRQDIFEALDDFDSAIEADPKFIAAYEARAQLRNVIDDFHGAIDDFNHAIELNPKLTTAYAGRGSAYLKHRDFDQGIADINEAIRLNPGDLGQSYEPTSDKALDPAALQHGEEQLQKMLADRPHMAEHIEKGDKLWNWAVRKFAGEDIGSLIFWDPTSPDPFASRSREPFNGEPAAIQLNLFQQLDHSTSTQAKREQQSFEELWMCAVFELYNVTSSAEWQRLTSEANAGKLPRDEFIQAMMRSEYNAGQRTRAFYVKFFLPWLRSKTLKDTNPDGWLCNEFEDPDRIRSNYAFRGKSLYLSFYENSYDVQAAYREGLRGNFNGAKEILTRVLEHPDGLAAAQLAYAHSVLAWVKQSTGDPMGAIEDLSLSQKEATEVAGLEADRAESLYNRAILYDSVGRRNKAIADLDAALELIPKSLEYLLMQATFLTRAGKYDDAKRDIEAALAIDPNSRAAFNLRGYLEYYDHDYARAVDDFTTAFDPKDAQLASMRGWSYMSLKDYDKAFTDLDRLVRLQPEDADAYYSRGSVFHSQKQYHKALADYDRATQLDPKLIGPYVNRAELFSEIDDPKLRRPAQALKDARRGCELTNWKEAEPLRALASAYAANGDLKTAIQWQEKALHLADSDHEQEYSQQLAHYQHEQHEISTPKTTPATQTTASRESPPQCCRHCSTCCRRRGPICRLFDR
jgi:tetratricopeptide (TPR) repeat protein